MDKNFEKKLGLYVVRNNHKYVGPFTKFERLGGRFSATWHWPAFFVPAWWFLYRKMYLWAAIEFFLTLFPQTWLIGAIAGGISGNWFYYRKMKEDFKAIAKVEDKRYALKHMGGVHAWVPWVALVINLMWLMVVASFWVVFLGIFRAATM
ncbi:hypothetical protein BerOc1_00514 [Pseudodesulfovibrio hydrargyri]|uniref:DUF2628 domain-containing protein n=1 Tax=Pseudodesulfovibrio hydrargyri TaxID=2125990 RepID=A0A1J5N193_9BACT|nr:hypothetical protein [Pseudodesulfovibrio hydrargyri]OIQ52042.1 hypothetical protein BerOc1_00514 [Pseudodesulfovibrio hydrargyri]